MIGNPKPRKKKRRNAPSSDAQRRLRLDVLRRDNFRCAVCRSERGLEVHHIISRRYLGAWAMKNMITLCAACHQGYSGRPDSHSHEARKRHLNLLRDRFGYEYTGPLWLSALEEAGE